MKMKIVRMLDSICNVKIHYLVFFISCAIIGMHTTAEYATEGIGEAITNLTLGILIWITGVVFGIMYFGHKHETENK